MNSIPLYKQIIEDICPESTMEACSPETVSLQSGNWRSSI